MILTITLGTGTPCLAQGVGGIRGTVSDAEFEGPVSDAAVKIVELNRQVSTTEDGHFLFGDIPAGSYTLSVSASGYERFVQSAVVVSVGSLAEVTVRMKGEFTEMDELVVRDMDMSDTASEAGLLNLRSTTLSFQDSVSKEMMTRAGASDAASALKLVVGASVVDGKYATVRGLSDRYVGVALNGIRIPSADPKKRAVQLDIIPAGSIESMSVSKTFTPDLPGDYSGGGINIRTISIPDKPFVKVSSSRSENGEWTGKDGFTTYGGGGCGMWGRDLGGRAEPDSVNNMILDPVLTANGKDVSFSYNDNTKAEFDKITRTLSPVLSVDSTRFPDGNYSYALSAGNRADLGDGWTAGIIGAFTYGVKYSEQDSYEASYAVDTAGIESPNDREYQRKTGKEELKYSELCSVGVQKGDEQSFNFTWLRTQSALDQATIRDDTLYPYNVPDDGVTRVQGIQYIERSLDARQLTWKRKWDDFEVEFFGANNIAEQYSPDTRIFKEEISGTGPWTSQLTQPTALQGLFDHSRLWQDIQEDNAQYGVNLKYPFKFNDTDGSLKTGWLQDLTHRSYKFSAVIYKQTSSGSTEYTYTDPNDSWANAFFGTPSSYDDPMTWYAEPLTYPPATVEYEGDQRLPSGYLMVDFPIAPKTKFVFGVRDEVTDISISPHTDYDTLVPDGFNYLLVDTSQGYIDLSQAGQQKDAEVHLVDASWLRSAGIVYEMAPKMNLRVSWSQTIARPTFRELAPVLSIDPIDGENYFGNKDLQISHLQNDDVRWEWFRKPGEVWTVSWFYKEVQDPIEKVSFGYFGDPYILAMNYPEGKIAGMEYEMKKDLDFIPLPIGAISAGVNYSVLKSAVTIPSEVEFQLDQYGLTPKERTAKDMYVSPFNFLDVPFLFGFFNIKNAGEFDGAQRDMEGQPAFLFNFNAGYNIKEWGTGFNWFYTVQGDVLKTGAAVATSGDTASATPDIYTKKRATLNFNVTQEFASRFKLTLAAQNLTDSLIEEVYRPPDGEDVARKSYREGVIYTVTVSGKW